MEGTWEIKYPGRTKTSTAARQFDTGVSGARGRKPWPKITWSSRLGVSAAGQLPAHREKKKLAKKPIGNTSDRFNLRRHKLRKRTIRLGTLNVKDIKTEQLQWYGHVQRMEEGRLPKEVLEWRPSGRRKRGRPKLTWAEGIRGMMGEKGLKEEDWADRNNWRRKIAWLRNGRRKMWKHWTTC